MENFYYTLVLIGGSFAAYYIVFRVGEKIAPSELGGIKVPRALGLVIQVLLPAVLLPLVAPAILKNLDKMYSITQEVSGSPYLKFISDFFESAENANKIWATLSIFLSYIIFKEITEKMPERPKGFGSFLIALAIVILSATASSILWDLVAVKVWLRMIQFFDSIWWDSQPGAVIREWIFPEQQRIVQ